MSDPSNSPTKTIESVLGRIGIAPGADDNIEKLFLLFILHGQKAAEKLVAEGKREPGHVIGLSITDLEAVVGEVQASAVLGNPIQLAVNITPGGIGFAAITERELNEIRAVRATMGVGDEGSGHGPH